MLPGTGLELLPADSNHAMARTPQRQAARLCVLVAFLVSQQAPLTDRVPTRCHSTDAEPWLGAR